jgi:hypothetical protein
MLRLQEWPIMATLNPPAEKATLYLEDLRIAQQFVSGAHQIAVENGYL